ncbi:hypothetical protein CICLE_v10023817mg, partial [Citrus x clementina]
FSGRRFGATINCILVKVKCSYLKHCFRKIESALEFFVFAYCWKAENHLLVKSYEFKIFTTIMDCFLLLFLALFVEVVVLLVYC